MTVACVLRSGGIYDATWVARLKACVTRHLTAPHRFLCLSDVDVPCERIPLEHDWPGWWSKVEVLNVEGPLVYFDLDTLIVGDLSDLADVAHKAHFATLRDFYRPKGLGSGVMVWSGNDITPYVLADRFELSPAKWMAECHGGDQEFIEKAAFLPGVLRLQDLLPSQIVSYKADRCADAAPAGARVICLHGKPKFGDMPADSWARREWEMAA